MEAATGAVWDGDPMLRRCRGSVSTFPWSQESQSDVSSRGWDQTGSNGANLSFPQEFHISPDVPDQHEAIKNQWIVGMINAAYVCSLPKFPIVKPSFNPMISGLTLQRVF